MRLERLLLPASLSMVKRKGGVAQGAPAALKAVVHRSGPPLLSPYRVEACRFRVPTLEVLPSPAESFRRLVLLALLKLPFLVRLEPGSSGEIPFPVDGIAEDSSNPEGDAEHQEKFASLSPMPGGVRQYKATLAALLDWMDAEPRSVQDCKEHMRERYEASSAPAILNYLRLLKSLGFVVESNGNLDLTEQGQAYRATRDPLVLFERLYETQFGSLLGAYNERQLSCELASRVFGPQQRSRGPFSRDRRPVARRTEVDFAEPWLAL